MKEPAIQGAGLDYTKTSDTFDTLKGTFCASLSPPPIIYSFPSCLFKQLLMTLHSLSLTHPSTPILQKIMIHVIRF